ncbi:FtsQ-type POTRA domain-containing protein [Microbacterium sp. 179-B 1A2 NHS]|uniref:FtsQ-type POTRA domain-containing protein n=1 Tax=Microbacterium sp. 179-B 1A2 NHS TaxID=3142383 RepID=UPI0039A0C3AF
MRRPSPLPSTPPAHSSAEPSDGSGAQGDTGGPDRSEPLLPAPARRPAGSARRSGAGPADTVHDDPAPFSADRAAGPAAPGPHDETVPLEPFGESGPLAPVVPFAPPVDGRVEPDDDVASAPADSPPTDRTGDTDLTADAPEDRPLGWRDVWTAARARRRALRREIRRFTARQRRRRNAWIAGLGAVVIVGLGAVATAYSPLFAVSEITVVGTDRLDADAVEAALGGQMGIPLALVDSSEVKAALVGFPLVETYTVEARPPQELVVRIVERTPIGSVSSKAGHTLVDAAGVALQTTKKAPKGYPRLDVAGGPGSRAFGATGAVYRSLPEDLRTRVSAMSATTPNDVTLTIDGADVLWGSSADSAEKAVVLAAAMSASPPDEVEMYDISSPGAVVIR